MQAMSARSFVNMKAILEFPTVLINYWPLIFRSFSEERPEKAPHDIDLLALERRHPREKPAPALRQPRSARHEVGLPCRFFQMSIEPLKIGERCRFLAAAA